MGSLYIISEAVPRLIEPEHSSAPGTVILAVIGIGVNGAAAVRVGRHRTLNARVIAWHLIEDVLGWAAVLAARAAMLFTDIRILDPILSILIYLHVLYDVVRNLRTTVSLLPQAARDEVEEPEIANRLASIPNVRYAQYAHVWSLGGERHVPRRTRSLNAARPGRSCWRLNARDWSA